VFQIAFETLRSGFRQGDQFRRKRGYDSGCSVATFAFEVPSMSDFRKRTSITSDTRPTPRMNRSDGDTPNPEQFSG
jgi:hypothetical protein